MAYLTINPIQNLNVDRGDVNCDYANECIICLDNVEDPVYGCKSKHWVSCM